MTSKKTAAELRAENRLLRQTHNAGNITSIINNLMRYATICFAIWCMYQSIVALAGKETMANILINLLGNINISDGLAYVLGTGGIVYGVRERRLRQKAIKHMSGRISDLEEHIDPKRSSSNLTKTGETSPRDKD